MDVRQTYKSSDTEEWLDRVWTRPIGYLWAKFFERLGVHPNTVTIISIVIGVLSAACFVHGSYIYEGKTGLMYNITGVLLLMWANFYDSADGQLARMTGKKTLLGRILDGTAEIIWFIFLYCALVLRFYMYHEREFRWLGIEDNERNAVIATLILLAATYVTGVQCHARHTTLSDYYRQIHLFFLNGGKSDEFDNAAQKQSVYDAMPWKGNVVHKMFLNVYIRYTRNQERMTPQFQQLMQQLKTKYVTAGNIPQEFRDEFRRQSLPLIPLTNILTFNTRAIALYLCCLADVPWMFLIFEIVVMSALCEYMRRRHERFCMELLRKISL